LTAGVEAALASSEDGWLLALAAAAVPHGAARAEQAVAAVGERRRRVGHARVSPASAPLAPIHRAN